MRALPLALASLVLLTGCAGQRPVAPESAAVSPPEKWTRPYENREPPTIEEWLQGFGDPALARLARTALERNVDIALAATRVAEARAQFAFAHAQRGINSDADLSGGHERSISPVLAAPIGQNAGSAALTIGYDADLFGRLSNASAAARASLLASESAQKTVTLAVLTVAVEGYVGLRALDERLRILESTRVARESEVRFTRRRADAGYSPVIDLKQAEAALHATEQQVPAIRLQIERQEHGLALLLGETAHPIERGLPFGQIRVPAGGIVVPSELLLRRPDIVQAQQLLIAADRSLDASRAAFLPFIQLKASGGWAASSLLRDDPFEVFALGGSILAPLFDSGRLRAQQGISAARRDQAAFAYRKVALNAFREVEDALAAIELMRAQLVATEAQREDLRRVLHLAVRRYRAGYSTYLEQLDAQRALLLAELAVVQARSEMIGSQIGLYRSIGGPWPQESDAAR